MHPIEKVFHGRNFSDGELQSARLNISGVKSKITSFLKERVEQSQADGVVFELSGDINSAVTAHLCVEALGTRRVVGMLMPDLRVTNAEDIDDAKEVASELCLEVHEFDIASVHKTFMKNLESNRTAEGELRARIRMSLLYYKAGLQNRLVVGTVDRTEFVLGSFPKHGDGAADVLPIADLYRSDVRRLGEVLGINRRVVVKRDQRSESGLPDSHFYPGWDKVDQVLRLWLDEGLEVEKIAARTRSLQTDVEMVISRYKSSFHNINGPALCSLR